MRKWDGKARVERIGDEGREERGRARRMTGKEKENEGKERTGIKKGREEG